MAKAIFREEAKRLFITEGLSLDAIAEMLKKQVSRRTLFTWKGEGDWENKRKEYLNQTDDLQKDLLILAKMAVKNAMATPTAHNFFAVCKAVAAVKAMQGVKLIEENTTPEERKGLTDAAIKEIEKKLFGLD